MTIILAAKTDEGVLLASDLAETVDVRNQDGKLLETVLAGYADKIRDIGQGMAAGIAGTLDSPERAFSLLSLHGPQGLASAYPSLSFVIASSSSLQYYIGGFREAHHCGIGAGIFPEVIDFVRRSYSDQKALEVFREAIKLSKKIGEGRDIIIDGFYACRLNGKGFELLERDEPRRPVLEAHAYLHA